MSTRVMTIKPQRLHALLDGGHEVTLVDVRSPAEFNAGYIEGATLIPLNDFSLSRLVGRAQRPGLGDEVTIFVTSQSGMRAQEAAERLINAGYRNVMLLEGGTAAWQNAGLPLQRRGLPSAA